MFLNHSWCLYKLMKYNCRLTEFKQDHLKFRMVSMFSKDYNVDAALLQRCNDNICNIIWHLTSIINAFNYYKSLIAKNGN